MKLRAFVVMPFGAVNIPGTRRRGSSQIDFNAVYTELLKPALEGAGCETFRADSEISAGDIRTDMFFELVTADVVIADLSVPNLNVFYELGVRDAACARGVLIVHGGWAASRPFDVAPDRSFKYDGRLFSIREPRSAAKPDRNENVAKEVVRLSKVFREALGADSQTMGSPVYSHLPGLKPVNWERIDTSKARYFGALNEDWQERVRTAEANQHPGHILTLAQDAPTRAHRIKILMLAARALIGLCRFTAAREVLTEVIHLSPDEPEAHLQLAVVLANLGETTQAEHELRRILQQHEHNPNADDLIGQAGAVLGYVHRVLWYLQWKDEPDPARRKEKAKESWRLLLSAIRGFADVHRRHTEQYLSGYNALLLMELLKYLFPDFQPVPPFPAKAELATVVRYTATAERENAEFTGDYDTQFWGSVALSGLDMLEGNETAAIQAVRDACSVPSATLYHLRYFLDRLQLLEGLQFSPVVVGAANYIVMTALAEKLHETKWNKVMLFYGYPMDTAGLDSSASLFPPASVGAVQAAIEEILDRWQVNESDLAICACSTEGDVMFAEACLRRKAHVRLLILEPTSEELVRALASSDSSKWTARARDLIDRPDTEVWYHRTELGDAVDRCALKARHNRWMLNTARMEVEGAGPVDAANGDHETSLFGLLLWQGESQADDPTNPAFFVAEIRKGDRYKGRVETINPCALATERTAAVQ
ncbi:MAG TPA: tetratricopeptide repeat protein [Bryobacteraceae bacterium]